MDINKENINTVIKEFSQIEKLSFIDSRNLIKFDPKKKEDLLFLSCIENNREKYINLLNYLTKKFQFRNIVELGNREGLSTISIYDALDNGSDFYSIDIEKDQRYCPDHMFTDPRMHFLFGDVCSVEIIGRLPNKIDLLFTDTIHFDFQLRDEWHIYQHLLADRALVAIDDINMNDKRKLFDEVTFEKWDLTELCHSSGWGLFLFERTVPHEKEKSALHIAIIEVWERKYNSLYEELVKLDRARFVYRFKKLIKKIKPAYYFYTYCFNHLNKILKGRKVYYPGKVRL